MIENMSRQFQEYTDRSNVKMFCVFHKDYFIRDDNYYFYFFGVNELYPKKRDINVILEYELDKYNPFLQKRGYMETSAYLHVYWNKLYTDKELVGFSQYDMKHNEKYEKRDPDTIYILDAKEPIVKNQKWSRLMFPNLRNLDFLIKSYNLHFKTKYSMKELENMPLSLWQTNIYPIRIYEKLCSWLEKLVEEIYPWSCQPPYETNFGSIGGYTERALSIFNALEIYEGMNYINGIGIKHYNLNISPMTHNNISKEQYNTKSYLNRFSQDIHTKYISNVTGTYEDVSFCMFKAQCVLHGLTYTCERIFKNKKNGLYFTSLNNSIRTADEFSPKLPVTELYGAPRRVGDSNLHWYKRDDWETHKEFGFTIEGEDPRIFILNEEVYVIFICISPYESQKRCIGITKFEEWKPAFLQVENMKRNAIEKNWAPFVKENKLYFVYNYDPLVILHYDLNPQGLCRVVFTQNNIHLPINTANTYLRGGSNLIHYKDGYYIGGCHSRIFKKCYEHYTHIILLNTNTWRLEYVSKPVMYFYDTREPLNSWALSPGSTKQLDVYYNILIDKSPNIIQDPISLYENDGKYYITINVRDCLSLLYEISFADLFHFTKKDKLIGYYDELVKHMIL